MAFSSMAAAEAPKKTMSWVALAAAVVLMVSTLRGGEASCQDYSIVIPANTPEILQNFTDGEGDFTDFLIGLYLGVGVQEYTFNGTTWVNTNVSAILLDNNGTKVGNHFFIPPPGIGGGRATWQYIDPPSQVTAKRLLAVTVSDRSIPWLLLEATFNSGDPTSTVGFGEANYVERLQTNQGIAPTTNCSAPGTIYLSPYNAVYAFYNVPTPAAAPTPAAGISMVVDE